MRVVSLNCSNTEIVCALGCADMLVGVDHDSDHPPDVVAPLPRVGRDLDIDVAKVAALKPDIVLASLTVPGHENVVADLEASALRFHAPETITLDDVYRDVRDIAALLGVRERGVELVSRMQGAMPPLGEAEHRPRILIEWWPKPAIAAGRQSWVHDLIALAGGVNAMGHRDVKSAPIADDQIKDLAPDAVVISWCGVPHEKYRPGEVYKRDAWKALPAVKGRRVYSVREAFLGRPGPRLVDGYHSLVRIVEDLQ